MAYEVDYFTVGEGEKGGDALALRFGNLQGARDQQTVAVIDGGTKESGAELVNHIRNHYHTDHVNWVFCTHPDSDHASGLCVVLEELSVGVLIMHKPWDHAASIKNAFKDGRITASGLGDKIEKSLQHASDLASLADKKKIQIVEPFQGLKDENGFLHILGPSREYYENMLAHFRCTPEPAISLGVFTPLVKSANAMIERIQDFMHIDLLNDDNDTTSAENNTSVIILLTIDGHRLLFTGDAGKTALNLAADYAASQGIALTNLALFDVPHHGSRRNLSSKVLKRINGQIACISAPKQSDKHPSRRVVNALQKHGATVYVTKGGIVCHPHNSPPRLGWVPLAKEPFYSLVEE